MARTKQTARRYEKPLITWTRFHLPRDQEWPIWSVDHDDVHLGPLIDVPGLRRASLGRMVDNPEQAAYIIREYSLPQQYIMFSLINLVVLHAEWYDLDGLKKFQSSPACAEFLQNLPEQDDSQASVETGSALENLALTDAPSSSLSSSAPQTSRFLIFKHLTQAATAEVEGRVTLTAFLVPHKVDSVLSMWREKFERVFLGFVPHGYETITAHPNFWFKSAATWLWVLSEDGWVENKFGKLAQTQGDEQGGRTILCHFHLWPRRCGATPEKEEAAAADPRSRESWNRRVSQVMPPATSWVQERWDIQDFPRPPEPEIDPEEMSE